MPIDSDGMSLNWSLAGIGNASAFPGDKGGCGGLCDFRV